MDDWLVEVRQQENNTCIDEAACCGYTRQALMALVHCGQRGVMHGDLRPSSLQLTTKEVDAAVKIGDFGIASVLDPDRSAVRRNGGPYTAPELLEGSAPFGSASPDVWSLGAIAHALLIGHPPDRSSVTGSHVLA